MNDEHDTMNDRKEEKKERLRTCSRTDPGHEHSKKLAERNQIWIKESKNGCANSKERCERKNEGALLFDSFTWQENDKSYLACQNWRFRTLLVFLVRALTRAHTNNQFYFREGRSSLLLISFRSSRRVSSHSTKESPESSFWIIYARLEQVRMYYEPSGPGLDPLKRVR